MRTEGLTRRALLGTATAGAVALALPQLRCGGGEDERSGGRGAGSSVIVVGAGLAGLVAADLLGSEGAEVTLIEARERLGGRVFTVRSPFAGGQIAEGGGEYIDAVHTVMLELVERFELELDDLNAVGAEGDGVVIRPGRRRLYEEVAATSGVEAETERFYEAIYELARPLGGAGAGRAAAELDASSAADLLDRLGISGDARFLLEQDLVGGYTVEPERLSLLFLASAERPYEEVPDRDIETLRINGGNDQLTTALAEDLEGEIVTGSPVDSVTQGSGGVTVEAAGRSYRADACVLALPLPALREIEIGFAAPPAVERAVLRTSYGAVTKTLMQFATRTWSEEGLAGYGLTDLPVGITWDATDAQPGERGILISYAAAAAGLEAAFAPLGPARAAAVSGAEA
ncbi:MAG: FAD-binding protein, partial [Actinobacteria bacterium]|nr:FAD-binding protein [Actinomycetota bacterium]